MNARPIAALVVGLALGAGLSACIDNAASIRLEAACFPPTPDESGLCSYAATCGSIYLGNPVVDVKNTVTGGTLVWPVQVGNQMAADADRAGGVNSKDAWIEGYTISYSSRDVSIRDVSVDITNHPVLAGGKSVVLVPVIPLNVATFLSGRIGTGRFQISAEVVAKGHLADGSAFETAPFTFSVTACTGTTCLPVFDDYDAAVAANEQVCDVNLPIFRGACPQEGQSSVPLCGAPAAP